MKVIDFSFLKTSIIEIEEKKAIEYITKFVYNFVITKEVLHMPTIKSSAELRNNYNEISTFSHKYSEPVFITKNAKGDTHSFSDTISNIRSRRKR